MNIKGWILSKCDQLTDGTFRPIISSMSIVWDGCVHPGTPTADTWVLVYVEVNQGQYEFLQSDPDVIWIGSEWDAPPPELLTAYASHLTSGKTYANLGQVLTDLAKWEPSFIFD